MKNGGSSCDPTLRLRQTHSHKHFSSEIYTRLLRQISTSTEMSTMHRISYTWPIRICQLFVASSLNLDLFVAAEAVKLVQKFEHGPLHLPVPRLLPSESLRADRVQLIDEDDSPALSKTKAGRR